jgi:hypothetical protein
MSRRFLLGTPKGQNTTADTFFNTLRETFYLVPTSAPTTFDTTFSTTYGTVAPVPSTTTYSTSRLTSVLTTYGTIGPSPEYQTIYATLGSTSYFSEFITEYLTYYNTNDIVPTSFSVITSFNTPYATTRPTSAPTDYPVITAYISTFGTMYSQNTNTSFVTNYTYPVPTEYITPYPLFTHTFYGTSRPTSVTEPVYQSTIYSNPTTYPGFTTPTAYPTSNPTSSSQSFSGCFYYDVNGNQTGSDPLPPAGCVNLAPCPFVDTTGTASVYTYYNTTRSTPSTTTFLTHVYIGQSTFNIFYTPGLTDPVNGIFGCYDAYDPDVFAYCYGQPEQGNFGAGTCQACEYFNSTTFDTDVGYDTYTTAPATVITTFETSALTSVSYLSSRCFPPCAYNCTVTTSYFTYVPTFYSPDTVVTSYPINTFIRNTTFEIITSFTTSHITFTGEYQPLNTLYVTQYPTSNVTSNLTTTSYIVNTTNPYNVPTAYLTSTSFITSFPTDYVTNNPTLYVTNIPTTFQTSHPTSNLTSFFTARTTELGNTSHPTTIQIIFNTSNLTDITTTFDTSRSTEIMDIVSTSNDTSRSTTRITEWLTTYPQNTEVLTSRSTTWFTQ